MVIEVEPRGRLAFRGFEHFLTQASDRYML